ncbi:winged helix-turn-helix domain-containing protein [Extibacter muris]|uniref:Winged helix family transcriptional regulator n=1 Tax=Extibacter muris TaxID=1796622 RepID=A0A4R4FA03_9FIRM|nr:winged helix-turn-helix domain-containing protein [Extibacter muris]MCU0081151.1 winged helix-turn-helix domain-containing protein [Extibacter muris]TDA20148.1 winged helix family transcriptional regulator [Extibacter muris]
MISNLHCAKSTICVENNNVGGGNFIEDKIFVFEKLCIDVAKRNVTINHNSIKLRRKEFDILIFLTEHPSWVYTKDQIYDAVWKDEVPVDIDNTVTCQIKQLRKKLGNNAKETPYIENVWGVGYRFNSGLN